MPRWGLGPRHPSKRVAALAAGAGSNAGSRGTRWRGRIASLGLLATLPVPQAGAEMSLGQGCSPGVAAPAPHLWASIATLRDSRRTPGVRLAACSLLMSFSYTVSREQGETRARFLPQTSARDVRKPPSGKASCCVSCTQSSPADPIGTRLSHVGEPQDVPPELQEPPWGSRLCSDDGWMQAGRLGTQAALM